MSNPIYNDEGLRVVREDYCCEHWEPDKGVLVPLRECWCCKWSNFRIEGTNTEVENLSVCNYEGDVETAINS